MRAANLKPRVVLTAVAISVIVGAAAAFGYLETLAHVRYIQESQQPSFHAIYQFREHQLRFIRTLGDYVNRQSEVDHATLMRRFDVLWSRVGPLLSKETAPLLGDPDEVRQEIARIEALLEQIDPLMPALRPGDHASAAVILAALEKMLVPYETLRRSMQSNAEIRNDDLIDEAKRYGYIQIALLSTSLITGGILCFLVFRHARRAHLLASRDPLTGLLNRSQLGRALLHSDQEGRDGSDAVALHCIDLDRFKSINDTLGHPIGDKLLLEVGRRLEQCIRAGDTIIRMGGDEFAIVQPGIKGAEQAERLAERLVQAGAEPFQIDGHSLTIGISVGCAVFPRDASTVSGLVEKADLALYEAKRRGRRTFSFFERSLEVHAIRQRYLEGELRKALAEGQLELHFQPKYRLRDGQLVGAEALLRWFHPEHGAISPAEFIPVAEECGLIGAIGTMVLETACHEAAGWHRLTKQPLHVSVNLSAAQFERQDVAALVRATLDGAHLDARLLDLEVTESLLLKNSDDVGKCIGEIRSIGVSLSLDDFGTGYASIGYLRQFRFDRVKIDKSFVDSLGLTADARSLIEAIVQLAHGMGMSVVAEGVETERQLEELLRMGCDEAQGFYLGHPQPATSFRKHVRAAPTIPGLSTPAGVRAGALLANAQEACDGRGGYPG